MADALKVHRYSEPGVGSVNSYAIVWADGIIVVDAQRQISSATAFADLVESLGKPPRTIVLTHPHPDHFGGLAVLKARFPDAALAMSQETADELVADSQGYFRLTRELMPDDTSPDLPPPDCILADGDQLPAGAHTFDVCNWGPGEATTATTLHAASAGMLFSADIVTHGMTPFLLEGRTAQWLTQIDRLATLHPTDTRTFSGHGPEGPLARLADQMRGYLSFVRERVVSGAEVATIKTEIEDRYPGFLPVAALPDLVSANIEAVRHELGQP